MLLDNNKENQILSNISSSPSDALCQMVISHRYLNISDKVCQAAMEELAKRRINGDQLDYETAIKEGLSKLPKLPKDGIKMSLNMNDLVSLIKNKVGIRK
jgi:hypothetical protein